MPKFSMARARKRICPKCGASLINGRCQDCIQAEVARLDMTEWEIVQHYNNRATARKTAIQILADLNDTTLSVIRLVLARAGVPGIEMPKHVVLIRPELR